MPVADTTVIPGMLRAANATFSSKSAVTNNAFLSSALFFMIVVSTLEWLPVLMVRADNVDSWVTLLLFPILAVNAYQLLALPKYNAKSDESAFFF